MGTCVLSIFVKQGEGGEGGLELAGRSHRLLVPGGAEPAAEGGDGGVGLLCRALPGAVLVQVGEAPSPLPTLCLPRSLQLPALG